MMKDFVRKNIIGKFCSYNILCKICVASKQNDSVMNGYAKEREKRGKKISGTLTGYKRYYSGVS